MKRYYNSSTKEWYTVGQSMTKKIDNGVFSGIPTEEQLTEWGFEEWVEPEPTPEELLQSARQQKLMEIEEYNQSDNVNGFTIDGVPMWLTVELRQQLATQISASEAVGRETMTRWYGGHSFTFPLATWKLMLVALEVYAGDSLNVTEEHKATIESLLTVNEIEEYNITLGYPEKLVFNT